MKGEDLLKNMNNIDNDLISTADEVPQSRKIHWKRYCTVAACLCIAVYAGVFINSKLNKSNVEPIFPKQSATDAEGELIKLTPKLNYGGMGFEGHLVYDLSELDSANPWNENTQINTLPIYKNLSYTDKGYEIYLSEETMLDMAQKTAAALHTEIKESKFLRESGLPYRLSAKADDMIIYIYGNGYISIQYDEGISLPSEYSFTYDNTDKESGEKTLSYLTDKFADLLQFENPIKTTWNDRTFAGDESREYEVYNNSENITEKILNYNFRKDSFAPLDNGNLGFISITDLLTAAELIGNYPVISLNEAKALLLDGKYMSSVPNEYLENGVVSEEAIGKTELVYRTSAYDEIYMPYYTFYLKLSDSEDGESPEGLKNYGVYYVPAVSGEYLVDYTLWNGQFN